MAFVPANGTQSSPVNMMQTQGVVATVAANSVASGTIARDVDDNVVYLMTNDWNGTANAISPFAIANYCRVKTSQFGAELTITPTDGIGLVVATGNAHEVTLPVAAQSKGRMIRVVAPGATAQNITIVGDGVETINGGANFILTANYQMATLFCDGTQWYANVGDPTP